ncbi:RmlC-like cupin [Fistulina hepatica ATCC 64428]|uniref:RmlC-like cupin n=1 Tax=Fistulina hepatica ATCC 64428 TaxID=1128425 RepID=A0A0D7A4X9_9AGAR|nr:RmlC-like cupin [Fistulina hepatica ATCC 64428]
MSSIKIVKRPSEERGHADHGWLKTFHTFSFAMYQDFSHSQHGPLRVINEDRVSSHTGFGTHSHREFEIFSYVVSGQLEHQDSMGNTEVLSRGALQMTSAGTGISHSEKAYGSKGVHFLQIWSLPDQSNLTPTYYTRKFTDAEKTDRWMRVVAPVGSKGVSSEREADGPAPVHTQLTLYATLLSPGRALPQEMHGQKGYIHIVQTSGYHVGPAEGASVRVGQKAETVDLREGDGAYIWFPKNDGKITLDIENVGGSTAEVVLFDLE